MKKFIIYLYFNNGNIESFQTKGLNALDALYNLLKKISDKKNIPVEEEYTDIYNIVINESI